MKSNRLIPLAALALAFASIIDSSAVLAAQSVPSERSKTAPLLLAPKWRSDAFPEQSTTRLQYQEISASRILKVQQYNESRRFKATQIGIGRIAGTETNARNLPALKWVSLQDGSSVARLEIGSPLALGLRVGLKVDALDPRSELRFAGSDAPSRVVAMMTGAEVRKLADAKGIFWTPGTDGQNQMIEVYLPANVSRNAGRLLAPQISHLLANTRNDFKMIKNLGEAAACNVDTTCRLPGGGGSGPNAPELGSNFVSAKNAVARMTYVDGGRTYTCTGTLLADTVSTSQIPYFYSANHCISNQTVASTLNTYWGFEATTCGSGTAARNELLGGGAVYLYSDANTDALLLKLNNAPPSGSEFAGWDTAALPASSQIIGIHHPQGDLKKVSSGQQASTDSDRFAVGWISGTTEGGSSGSGVFTSDSGDYRLRGGLWGGSAECSNSGSLGNDGNRDYYSRFDVVFPSISQYLSPTSATPIRVNGSHPLTHSGAAATTASATRTKPATPVPPASPGSRTIQQQNRTNQQQR